MSKNNEGQSVVETLKENVRIVEIFLAKVRSLKKRYPEISQCAGPEGADFATSLLIFTLKYADDPTVINGVFRTLNSAARHHWSASSISRPLIEYMRVYEAAQGGSDYIKMMEDIRSRVKAEDGFLLSEGLQKVDEPKVIQIIDEMLFSPNRVGKYPKSEMAQQARLYEIELKDGLSVIEQYLTEIQYLNNEFQNLAKWRGGAETFASIALTYALRSCGDVGHFEDAMSIADDAAADIDPQALGDALVFHMTKPRTRSEKSKYKKYTEYDFFSNDDKPLVIDDMVITRDVDAVVSEFDGYLSRDGEEDWMFNTFLLLVLRASADPDED